MKKDRFDIKKIIRNFPKFYLFIQSINSAIFTEFYREIFLKKYIF